MSMTALLECPLPALDGGHRIREVLFATDLSRASDLAFDHARQIAERFGAPLTLYHVVETPRGAQDVDAECARAYIDWKAPDLTVMATHGRHGLARVFLGSVAEHVLQHSRRPCCA